MASSRSVPIAVRPDAAAEQALALAREDARPEVLEWAAKSLRRAVDSAPPRNEERLERLCDLAEVLLDRFREGSNRVDVQEAVTRLQEAVSDDTEPGEEIVEPEAAQAARAHMLLARSLERWYELDRSLPALGEAARQYRAALDLPLPPSDRALALAGRGRVCDLQGRREEATGAYESCLAAFEQLGLADYPDAVEARTALDRLRGLPDA